jgi:cobalt-zinc-cadmium efflux system protein
MSHRLSYSLAIVIAAFAFVLEMVSSYYTNSQALFGDAWHVLGDSVPLMLGLYAHESRKKQKNTDRLEFGVSALNILFLWIAAIEVGVQGAWRLIHPADVLAGQVIVISAIGAACNAVQIRLAQGLKDAHNHAYTAKGQEAHFISDFFSSLAVIVGALLIVAGFRWGDAAASLVVAGIIFVLTARFLGELKRSRARQYGHQTRGP